MVVKTLMQLHTRTLFDYWCALPTPHDIPSKEAVDPLDMPPDLLPHVFLCSVSVKPLRIFYRLQGTFISGTLGQHFTGKYLDASTFGDDCRKILNIYRRVVETKRPVMSHELVHSASGMEVRIEVLHLPLCDETGRLAFVIGAIDRLSDDDVDPERFVSYAWDIEDTHEVI